MRPIKQSETPLGTIQKKLEYVLITHTGIHFSEIQMQSDKMPKSLQRKVGCFVGRNYPSPVEEAKASLVAIMSSQSAG